MTKKKTKLKACFVPMSIEQEREEEIKNKIKYREIKRCCGNCNNYDADIYDPQDKVCIRGQGGTMARVNVEAFGVCKYFEEIKI